MQFVLIRRVTDDVVYGPKRRQDLQHVAKVERDPISQNLNAMGTSG